MTRPRLDLAGAVTVSLGLAALLYAVTEASRVGWGTPAVLTALAVSGLLLAGFVLVEHRSAAPLVPLPFLARRPVALVTSAMLLKSTVGIASATVPTLYLQQVLGWSPLPTGLAFVPGGLAGTLVGLTAARVIPRLGGPGRAAVLGLAVQAAGLLAMTALPPAWVPVLLLVGNTLLGPGLVLSDVALASLATAGLADRERGLGAGVFRTAGQLGAGLGLGVIVAVVVSTGSTRDAVGEALIPGLRAGLLCGAAFTLLALVLTVALLRSRHLEQAEP